MSLRIVAGETCRLCRSTRVLLPTGSRVDTKSSTMARSTSSLRSSTLTDHLPLALSFPECQVYVPGMPSGWSRVAPHGGPAPRSGPGGTARWRRGHNLSSPQFYRRLGQLGFTAAVPPGYSPPFLARLSAQATPSGGWLPAELGAT